MDFNSHSCVALFLFNPHQFSFVDWNFPAVSHYGWQASGTVMASVHGSDAHVWHVPVCPPSLAPKCTGYTHTLLQPAIWPNHTCCRSTSCASYFDHDQLETALQRSCSVLFALKLLPLPRLCTCLPPTSPAPLAQLPKPGTHVHARSQQRAMTAWSGPRAPMRKHILFDHHGCSYTIGKHKESVACVYHVCVPLGLGFGEAPLSWHWSSGLLWCSFSYITHPLTLIVDTFTVLWVGSIIQ